MCLDFNVEPDTDTNFRTDSTKHTVTHRSPFAFLSIRLTLDKVVVSFAPSVTMVGGQNANRLFVGLKGRVPDLLQLNVDLIYGQW